jgi:uncharacterized protein YdhG (YjbR/CyaY superfamily)
MAGEKCPTRNRFSSPAKFSHRHFAALHGTLKSNNNSRPFTAKEKQMSQSKSSKKGSEGFTEEEKAAMQERAKELKRKKSDGESDLLEKIGEMDGPDRAMAQQLHALIKANAPELSPKTWYGMPAYANKDGKVVCFFQAAQKFKARYATFGFNDSAHLDEDAMWPTAFALKELTPTAEKKIVELVQKAVS